MASYTKLLNLYKLDTRAQEWGYSVNDNFKIIDNMSSLRVSTAEELKDAITKKYDQISDITITVMHDIEFPSYTTLLVTNSVDINLDLQYHTISNILFTLAPATEKPYNIRVYNGRITNTQFKNSDGNTKAITVQLRNMVVTIKDDAHGGNSLLFTAPQVSVTAINTLFDHCDTAITVKSDCLLYNCYFDTCTRAVSFKGEKTNFIKIISCTATNCSHGFEIEGASAILQNVHVYNGTLSGIYFKAICNNASLTLWSCTIRGIVHSGMSTSPSFGGLVIDAKDTTLTGITVTLDGCVIYGCDRGGVVKVQAEPAIQLVLTGGVLVDHNYAVIDDDMQVCNIGGAGAFSYYVEGAVTQRVGIYAKDAKAGDVFGTCSDEKDVRMAGNIVCDNKALKAVKDGMQLKWAAL